MLFWHFDRAAASRTFCTAGSNRPMRTAMIAITTRSSISVKPRDRHLRVVVRTMRGTSEGNDDPEIAWRIGTELASRRQDYHSAPASFFASRAIGYCKSGHALQVYLAPRA